jgi:hypothetical protein
MRPLLEFLDSLSDQEKAALKAAIETGEEEKARTEFEKVLKTRPVWTQAAVGTFMLANYVIDKENLQRKIAEAVGIEIAQ